MPNLIKKIQNTVFQNELWQKGAKVVLGVSGGPDSVCLLDMMAKIAPKYDLKLIVAHVNYGLRGKDSEKDEQFVRELADEYRLPVEVLKTKGNQKDKGNLENKLRNIRYEFFERVRKENNFDLIAVAHNLDDQAETFLMRIIRGAGLRGLSAMRYKTGKIIRPLLGTTRAEILEYLKGVRGVKGVRGEKGAEEIYRTDRTNSENIFFRNKVRNKLIPFLEKNFNPKIRETIFDASIPIAEDYSLIEELAEKAYMTNRINMANGTDFFSAKKILKLHPALQKNILLRIISEMNPQLKDIEASHIREVLKALRSTKSKNQIVVFKGLKLARRGDKVTISKLNN